MEDINLKRRKLEESSKNIYIPKTNSAFIFIGHPFFFDSKLYTFFQNNYILYIR
jgi:hypothetical protein